MASQVIVRSLSKGLDVLRVVGHSAAGMRLSEVATALGQKVPSTHYLVQTLLVAGFLEKRAGGLLAVGPALLELASQQQNSVLEGAAERELQHLHDALPEAIVIFGIATRQEMRQLYRISPDRPQVLQRCNGDSLHPYASASGLVGLAFSSDEARLSMEERHPFAEYGAHLWKRREDLEGFLAEVRARAMAVSPFDARLFHRVAAPVLDGTGRLAAVLGASLPATRVATAAARKHVLKELRQSAERLGETVSGRKP